MQIPPRRPPLRLVVPHAARPEKTRRYRRNIIRNQVHSLPDDHLGLIAVLSSRQKCPNSSRSIILPNRVHTGRAPLQAMTVRWRSRGNSTTTRGHSRTPRTIRMPLHDSGHHLLLPHIPSVAVVTVPPTRDLSQWRLPQARCLHTLATCRRRRHQRQRYMRRFSSLCYPTLPCLVNASWDTRLTCSPKSNMNKARPLARVPIHTIRESPTLHSTRRPAHPVANLDSNRPIVPLPYTINQSRTTPFPCNPCSTISIPVASPCMFRHPN